jgi:hypothetical protein
MIPCKRIKDKNNKLFKLVGFGNKDKVEVDYLCYFDEFYFYPIKNNEIKDDITHRRIGNRYNLKFINHISIKVRLNNNYKIIIYYKYHRKFTLTS